MDSSTQPEELAPLIIIVGAGVAGLQALNAVLKCSKKFRVICLETLGAVGGVWSRCDDAYRLQVPYSLYAMPSYPWPFKPSEYPSGPEVYRYILSFAEAHDLMQHIKLGCRVDNMLQDPSTRSWSVTYTELASGQQLQLSASYVVVCSGAWNDPFIPPYPGQAQFEGLQVHSKNFLDARAAVGKRLVIIGSGKGALDALAVALTTKAAARVVLLQRRLRWPFPRKLGKMGLRRLVYSRVTTAMMPPYYNAGAASRALHALASPVKRLFWRSLASAVRRHFRLKGHELAPAHSLMHDLMADGQVVDDTWPKLMRDKRVVRMTGEVASFTPCSVKLKDGREVQCDMILYCTGYNKSYDFLPDSVRAALDSTRMFLYRHMLHPDVPNLAFVGAEVNTYNNILTHGLQAEWLARVLEGSLVLPSPADMHADITRQQRWAGSAGVMESVAERNMSCNVMLYINSYHDLLCSDMGERTRRKGWKLIADCASGYTAKDYAQVVSRQGAASSKQASSKAPSCFPWPWSKRQRHQLQAQLQEQRPSSEWLQVLLKGVRKARGSDERGSGSTVTAARYSPSTGAGSSVLLVRAGEHGLPGGTTDSVTTANRGADSPTCGPSSHCLVQLAAVPYTPVQVGHVHAGLESVTNIAFHDAWITATASAGSPGGSEPLTKLQLEAALDGSFTAAGSFPTAGNATAAAAGAIPRAVSAAPAQLSGLRPTSRAASLLSLNSATAPRPRSSLDLRARSGSSHHPPAPAAALGDAGAADAAAHPLVYLSAPVAASAAAGLAAAATATGGLDAPAQGPAATAAEGGSLPPDGAPASPGSWGSSEGLWSRLKTGVSKALSRNSKGRSAGSPDPVDGKTHELLQGAPYAAALFMSVQRHHERASASARGSSRVSTSRRGSLDHGSLHVTASGVHPAPPHALAASLGRPDGLTRGQRASPGSGTWSGISQQQDAGPTSIDDLGMPASGTSYCSAGWPGGAGSMPGSCVLGSMSGASAILGRASGCAGRVHSGAGSTRTSLPFFTTSMSHVRQPPSFSGSTSARFPVTQSMTLQQAVSAGIGSMADGGPQSSSSTFGVAGPASSGSITALVLGSQASDIRPGALRLHPHHLQTPPTSTSSLRQQQTAADHHDSLMVSQDEVMRMCLKTHFAAGGANGELILAPTLSKEAARLRPQAPSPPVSNTPLPMVNVPPSALAPTGMLSSGAAAAAVAPAALAAPVGGEDARTLFTIQSMGSSFLNTHQSSSRPSPNGRMLSHAGNRSLNHSFNRSCSVATERSNTTATRSASIGLSQPGNHSASTASNLTVGGLDISPSPSLHRQPQLRFPSSSPASAREAQSVFAGQGSSLHGASASPMRANEGAWEAPMQPDVPAPAYSDAARIGGDAYARLNSGRGRSHPQAQLLAPPEPDFAIRPQSMEMLPGQARITSATRLTPSLISPARFTAPGATLGQPMQAYSAVDTTGISRLDELLRLGVFARQSAQADAWQKKARPGPDGGPLEGAVPLTMAERARANLDRITESVSSQLKRALSNSGSAQAAPAPRSSDNVCSPAALSGWLAQRHQGQGLNQQQPQQQQPRSRLALNSMDLDVDAFSPTAADVAAGAAGAAAGDAADGDDHGWERLFDSGSTVLDYEARGVMTDLGEDAIGMQADEGRSGPDETAADGVQSKRNAAAAVVAAVGAAANPMDVRALPVSAETAAAAGTSRTPATAAARGSSTSGVEPPQLQHSAANAGSPPLTAAPAMMAAMPEQGANATAAAHAHAQERVYLQFVSEEPGTDQQYLDSGLSSYTPDLAGPQGSGTSSMHGGSWRSGSHKHSLHFLGGMLPYGGIARHDQPTNRLSNHSDNHHSHLAQGSTEAFTLSHLVMGSSGNVPRASAAVAAGAAGASAGCDASWAFGHGHDARSQEHVFSWNVPH